MSEKNKTQQKDLLNAVGELLKRFAKAYSEFRNNDCDIQIEYHAGKDYYTIDCTFRSGNSEYKDCVVFYLNEDFNSTEIIEDFDKIYAKAKTLLKS